MVDVLNVIGDGRDKFVIRPDAGIDVFLEENPGYCVYLSAVCGFRNGSGVVLEQYEKKLSWLYDEICGYLGVSGCSPIWVVTMRVAMNPYPIGRKDCGICFGIDADVRSVYRALRLIYGICSLLWWENGGVCVPVSLYYYYTRDMVRTTMDYRFFKDFYDYVHNDSKMYGWWKVFGVKLVGERPGVREMDIDEEFRRCIRMCSSWYEKVFVIPGLMVADVGENGVNFDSERVSQSGSITTNQSDFERYCGQFLIG